MFDEIAADTLEPFMTSTGRRGWHVTIEDEACGKPCVFLWPGRDTTWNVDTGSWHVEDHAAVYEDGEMITPNVLEAIQKARAYLYSDRRTALGGFHVYHKITAPAPEAHNDEGGDWYYAPVDCDGLDVWGAGYPTPEAALEVAEREEQQLKAEYEARIQEEQNGEAARNAGLADHFMSWDDE